MTNENQAKLKAYLIRRAETRKAYAGCHPQPIAYNLPGHGWNPTDKQGLRWAESLDGCGLRVVAYADEIVRLSHTGWFTNEFRDETLRGVVLQLPARNGVSQYLPAYEDPNNTGTYRVDCSEIYRGEKGGERYADDYNQAKRDAARAADALAECEAETQREYDEAWQAGSQYRDLRDEIASNREHLRALVRELKTSRAYGPVVCRLLRENIRDTREDMHKAWKRADELRANVWNGTRDAFNEGAGITE